MLFYFHMDDDKEKMVEKYGDWARLMTESEAKSMLNDYGKVMQIMKWFLEGVFGEGYRYSIDDGESSGYGRMTLSGDLHGVASYTVTLTDSKTRAMFSFSYELPELDCKPSELDDEISQIDPRVSWSYDLNYESDVEEDISMISLYLTMSTEPNFGNGIPAMEELVKFDNEVKEIINSHKK